MSKHSYMTLHLIPYKCKKNKNFPNYFYIYKVFYLQTISFLCFFVFTIASFQSISKLISVGFQTETLYLFYKNYNFLCLYKKNKTNLEIDEHTNSRNYDSTDCFKAYRTLLLP